MAGKEDNVEFEFSIEKLSFKYKGPASRGRVLQQSVNSALAVIADAQLQAGADTPAAHRGLPRLVTAKDVSPTNDGSSNTGDKKTRKATDGKLSGLLDSLITEGFFSEKRKPSSIREELSKNGHNYKDNHIAATLGHFVRAKKVKREKDSEDKWVYFLN